MIRLWDLTTGKEPRRFQGHTGRVCSVAFSPDGHRALSGGVDGTARVWDVKSGKPLRCIRGHGGIVSSVTFLPSGSRVLSGSYDRTIRIWKTP
jgi:WD40 repeat protein